MRVLAKHKFLTGAALLMVAVAAALLWLLESQSGATWVAARLESALAGKLALGRVAGTLSGPFTLTAVRYHDPQTGLDACIQRLTVKVVLPALLSRQVRVSSIEVEGALVALPERSKPSKPQRPFSLTPPIDIVLDRFELRGARVTQRGRTLLTIDQARLAASWTHAGLAVRQFWVNSRDGAARFAGTVSVQHSPDSADSHSTTLDGADSTTHQSTPRYLGYGSGSMRWSVASLTYAGTLRIKSERQPATLELQLSSPFNATLNASLAQQHALPWSFELRVSQFDPRQSFMPGGSFESLATTLRGRGDRVAAEISGEATINGQRVLIEPLRLRRQEQAIQLDTLKLATAGSKGSLTIAGEVRFDRKPLYADLRIHADELTLPAQWVGQQTEARGELALQGDPTHFDTSGRLAAGPPGHLADITLTAAGSPQQLDIQRLSVIQQAGHLKVKGKVQIKPNVRWDLAADASRFDPGALFAAWHGNLDLALRSRGELRAAGPSGSLDLKRLAGTLGGRALEGRGHLSLGQNYDVGGGLYVRSGQSTLQVTGTQGSGLQAANGAAISRSKNEGAGSEALGARSGAGGGPTNVSATLAIGAVNEWVPSAHGRVTSRVQVTGRWPDLHVSGTAHGGDLALATQSVRAMDMRVEVRRPKDPQGSVNVTARDVQASGFSFSTANLQVSGAQADHTVQLRADGQPLGMQLQMRGARHADRLSESIQQLTVNARDLPQIRLQQPAQITLAGKDTALSHSCLVDNEMSLCAAAERRASGEAHAQYAFQHVPLGLLATVAAPGMPARVSGTIDGNGEIRQSADGAVLGNATLTSASGRISQPQPHGAWQELLAYSDLKIGANLTGDNARVTAGTALNNGGRIQGQATLAAVRGPAPRLSARAEANLPSLAPIGMLAPQLANIQGNCQLNATANGTLTQPQLSADVHVNQFGAELAVLGLKLHDGALTANLKPDTGLNVTGGIASGNGRLDISGGGALRDQSLQLKISGKDVQAANTPGASLSASPELQLNSKAGRVELRGTLVVPQANVDISKLPKSASPRRPSPDAVVVDEPKAQARKAQAMQLRTDVTVDLGQGDNVKLAGFGLNARLQGKVEVRESPNEKPTGSGDIGVAGTFNAYGQDLTISDGHLMFAGTPLNDPQLNITATRQVQDVSARLMITGTAQRPLLNVSSNQDMSQTEALSYLVAGKPTSQLQGNEGSSVQNAGQSLAGAAGNLVAKDIGQRLGVSELGVENSEAVGGSALTIGQYLSPRLLISYGMGIFQTGQVVTLRYKINNKVSLDAIQGTLDRRAGLSYRIEK